MNTKAASIEQLFITADSSYQLTDSSLILNGSSVSLQLPFTPKRYLYHGWQSWSLTAWIDANYKLATMRPSILHPMQTDPVYVHDRRPNGAWYGAAELQAGQIFFLGALGLEAHVALEGNLLTGWYETGNGEWLAAVGEEAAIFEQYAGLLKERWGTGRSRMPYRVWCSWYSLYTEIDEKRLLKVLGDLGDLPFEVFQIDDGWQKSIGDWEANAKFPTGMDGMAAKIKATGRLPGLWLAPLLIVPSSDIYRQHRDWLLRAENGRLVSAGFNWGEPLYALDTTHPEALDWLARLMKRVRAWGYEYAKLDFLYAGALPGKRYNGTPREAAYRHGLSVIRQALGEAYFLTCGAPILPSLGLCDGMRVGPDVAGHWNSHRDDDLLVNFAAPGVRNALRTTLNRLWLQPLVHTDPDVVYFRATESDLTSEQKSLLQDLAQVAGFKATSDIPTWLKAEETQALRSYLENRPRVERDGPFLYRIDQRLVDFSQAIQMPASPTPLIRAIGAITGKLASIPWIMKIVDSSGHRALSKRLRANPV